MKIPLWMVIAIATLLPGPLAMLALAEGEEDKPKLSFAFKAIAFSRVPGLDEVFHGEEEDKVSLRLPTRNFSPETVYEGKNPVTFYGRRTKADGEIEYLPVAAVTAPKEWKRILLVFLPASRQEALSTGRRFQVLAVDGALAQFRGGGRHFVNVSTTDVAAAIGDQKLLIPAGASATFAPKIQGDPSLRVPVQFHYRQDSQWRLLSSTRWSLDSRLRTLIFIFEDPRRKRLALRGVSERVL